MSCRTNCCKKIPLVAVLLVIAVMAVPAFGQTCLQNEYNLVNKQKLNCTANDVRIAKVQNVSSALSPTLKS